MNDKKNSVKENLLDGFPTNNYDDWKASAEKSLKGKPLDKLNTMTYEGIKVKPFYMKDDIEQLPHLACGYVGFEPYVRGNSPLGYKQKPWDIAQVLLEPLPKKYNQSMKHALKNGQNCVVLSAISKCMCSENQVPDGTLISSIEDFQQAFEGIDLTKYPLYIRFRNDSIELSAMFLAYLKKNNINPKVLRGAFDNSFLSELENNGSMQKSWDAAMAQTAELVSYCNKNLPNFKVFTIDAAIYNDNGANAVQQLGFALSKAVMFLREMLSRGITIDSAAKSIRFSFAIGPDFFMEIAKLRAARVVWAKIIKEFGGNTESEKMEISSRTCRWNRTALDVHVNMLRSTGESLSAIIAGVDSLTVEPFDHVFKALPSEFSGRIARNIQNVLMNECDLTDTADPAAGSYFVEYLTHEIITKSWELFRDCERKGGYKQVLEQGYVHQQIAEIAQKRLSSYATRKEILVGTNKYANPSEKPLQDLDYALDEIKKIIKSQKAEHLSSRNNSEVEKLLNVLKSSPSTEKFEQCIDAALVGATFEELNNVYSEKLGTTEIPHSFNGLRASAEFEALRSKAQPIAESTKVVFVPFGMVSEYKPRVDFVSDFVKVAGLEPDIMPAFSNAKDALAAYKKIKNKVLVLCSSDELYQTIIPEFVPKMKAECADKFIVLAGLPTDKADEYKQNGVDLFIHIKANILETMHTILHAMA